MPQVVIIEDTLTAEQHSDLGVIYENKGLFDLAEKEYGLASGKRKDWAVPRFNLGNLFYKRGDFGKAEGFYREALDRDPGNPDALNNLANALLMQGRRGEAKALVEKALAVERKEEYLDTYRRIVEKEGR